MKLQGAFVNNYYKILLKPCQLKSVDHVCTSLMLMFLLCFAIVCKPLPSSSHPTPAAAAADPVNKESVIPVTSSLPWSSLLPSPSVSSYVTL